MQTATAPATLPVAPRRPVYTGPLARFLKKQAEVKEATKQAQQQDTLRAMRVNIMELVSDPYLFTDAERLRTNDSVYQTTCLAKLQTWFRNVYAVLKQRETSLRMAFEDGTYCHIPVTA
jgi:Ni,Fe-hydrogenase I large subunit